MTNEFAGVLEIVGADEAISQHAVFDCTRPGQPLRIGLPRPGNDR